MDCWAIIPVKPLGAGKSRLAAVLGVEQRAALNKHLFGCVLNATLGVFKPDRVAIVTADPLLLPLMRGQGLHGLEDTGAGLNAALGLACRHATTRGARGIVILPDREVDVGTIGPTQAIRLDGRPDGHIEVHKYTRDDA